MSGTIVRVALGARSYDIVIGPGLVDEAGRQIAAALPGARLAIVTDATLAALHLPRLEASLGAAGLEAAAIVVPSGEPSKSFAMLERVVEDILAARLERSDAVVAFGGGVVGDLAGFAAAIARRGMALVQMPTTLLAQVDSSVGGKTGINSRLGKNLVGAFHQPRLVLADTGLLDTLPQRELAAGYAEIVKYGLIGDAAFFAWLEVNHAAVFAGGPERQEAIARSCRAKAAIVARDEEESGERALLNLGHTFGHALEAFCGYDPERLIHGEAVAIGLALAHDFSAAEGLAPAADAERLRRHLDAVGLPSRIGAIPGERPSAEALMRHIAQDKKVRRGRLTFVLSRGIGRAFIARVVAPEQVRAFLEHELVAG
jgi:3-dehydroquinate synthase